MGPTGPQGEPGPAGSGGAGGGGAFVLDVPDNEASHGTATRIASMSPTWTFNLAEQAAIPANAKAVYVDIAACIPEGCGPGQLLIRVPGSTTTHSIFAGRRCTLYGKDSKALWLPASGQTLTVEAYEQDFNPTCITAHVKVLGWYSL